MSKILQNIPLSDQANEAMTMLYVRHEAKRLGLDAPYYRMKGKVYPAIERRGYLEQDGELTDAGLDYAKKFDISGYIMDAVKVTVWATFTRQKDAALEKLLSVISGEEYDPIKRFSESNVRFTPDFSECYWIVEGREFGRIEYSHADQYYIRPKYAKISNVASLAPFNALMQKWLPLVEQLNAWQVEFEKECERVATEKGYPVKVVK